MDCVSQPLLLQKPQFTCGKTFELRLFLPDGVLFIKSKCVIFRILLEPSFPIAITEVDSDPYLLVLWNLPFYPLQASVLPGTCMSR